MQATHTALRRFPQLSLAALRANSFPALQNQALISIGQLCKNGFADTFRKDHLTSVKQKFTITSDRDTSSRLYYIDLAPRPQPNLLNTRSLPTFYAQSAYKMLTKSDLVRYLHRAAFSPVISTWTSAIYAVY